MIDLVFIVDDPVKWHIENFKMNFNHYSAIRWCGPRFLTYVQENMAAGIFYNPFVNVEDRLIKYGVMSTQALRDDLINWNNFYIAGRLQKPVKNLINPKKELARCIEKNRMAALSFSLIQLPEFTTTQELYITISRLSYTGDFRMHVGEHPNKPENIVLPLMKEFDKIYYPLLKSLKDTVQLFPDGTITNSTDDNAIFDHMMKLPHPIQCSIVKKFHRNPKYYCVEESMAHVSRTKNVKEILKNEIVDIVFVSSLLQTFQGFFSAGIVKSMRYGFEKLKKKHMA